MTDVPRPLSDRGWIPSRFQRLWFPPDFFLFNAVLVVAPLVLYSGALTGQFVYLDTFEIEGNPTVTNAALGLQSFTHAAQTSIAGRGFYYRPLYFFSYWLIYRLAGPKPFAFHLAQLLVFTATVWILFRLACDLFEDKTPAFLGALLWCFHPANVEAVAWISSFCDVGCAFFYLSAFWLFLRAEKNEQARISRHIVAASLFLAALLFKEMALSFPLLLLTYWFFVANQAPRSRQLLFYTPYLFTLILYFLARIQVLGRMTSGGHPLSVSWALLRQAASLFGEHTRLFFWPAHLTLARTAGLAPGSLFPWAILTILGLSAVFALRKQMPVVAFLVFWWPVALIPCLDIRQITFPYVADRFSYLPSAGLCLAIAYTLARLVPRRFPALFPPQLGTSALIPVMLLWAFQSFRTIPHWRSDDALSEYSIQEGPSVPIFHAVRGRVLATQYGDLVGAVREYNTALQLSLSNPSVWASVAHDAHMGLGNTARMRDQFDETVREYQLAAADMPANNLAYKQLASLYLERGDLPKVADYLSQAVKAEPQDLEAKFNLGVCWLKLGNYREAASNFSAVISVDPNFPHIWEAEAEALARLGDLEGAAKARQHKVPWRD